MCLVYTRYPWATSICLMIALCCCELTFAFPTSIYYVLCAAHLCTAYVLCAAHWCTALSRPYHCCRCDLPSIQHPPLPGPRKVASRQSELPKYCRCSQSTRSIESIRSARCEFDVNRGAVGMLNPLQDKKKKGGTYWGGKMTTLVTTACQGGC